MCFSRRHKVARPIAVIFHGLFLAVLTLALQPRVFDPFEDRLPIKASKLVALADLIPGAALHRGFKSSQNESRTAFSLAKIYQPIDLEGVSVIDSQQTHVPYQRPVDAARLIRAPPLR